MNHYGLVPARQWCLWFGRSLKTQQDGTRRCVNHEAFQRRDNVWVPPLQGTKEVLHNLDATQLLVRAGFLRRAYSGIFHLLPLGLRVQEKLERLINKHMRSLNASKVSLSSISSEQLWAKSGRLGISSEYFQLEDRTGSKFLLAPTHEEEITSIIADTVHSHNDLPVRLYQISRKYRDELRPRGGLLRGREFLMKDLYTFDATEDQAHATYHDVRAAYRNFLEELKLQYIEARADSGTMGGDLSHEYHLPDAFGEDDVLHCTNCTYARNEEFVGHEKVGSGDECPQCKDGTIRNTKCIEVGHTFHLGTRYSSKLKAEITLADGRKAVPLEMGCHGIGVSRLIAAIASRLSDEKGLNWPKVVAPYQVAVLVNPTDIDKRRIAVELCKELSGSETTGTAGVDVLLDDRAKHSLGFKLQDADLIGYPVLIVAGRGLDQEVSGRTVEVQCRRLKVKKQIRLEEVPHVVQDLLAQL